jgi:hypothetical protein
MEGNVTKRGGKIANWKERHMVLHGESDNHNLEYFDRKPEVGKKPKGVVELSGYRVRKVPEEGLNKSAILEQIFMRAQLKEGQYALKLGPWSKFGPMAVALTTLILTPLKKAKSGRGRKKKEGCWYAKTPEDPNPVE